jgi:hypothetical protein
VAQTADPADPVDAAWTQLLAHWADAERHRAFIALAAALSRLPDAAARYRTVESDPEHSEAAARAKKTIVAQAMAVVDATPRTTPEEARRTARSLIPIAALGLILAISWMLSALTRSRLFVSPITLAVEILVVALLPWRRILG